MLCYAQDPTAEHETYRKGQHLKGVDAANAERVRAEMVRLRLDLCHANNIYSNRMKIACSEAYVGQQAIPCLAKSCACQYTLPVAAVEICQQRTLLVLLMFIQLLLWHCQQSDADIRTVCRPVPDSGTCTRQLTGQQSAPSKSTNSTFACAVDVSFQGGDEEDKHE